MQLNTLEMIFKIGESFFSVNQAKELLEMILNGAKQICSAERATLFLSEDADSGSDEVLKSYVATDIGGELKEIRIPSNIGIAGYSYKTKEALIVNEVKESPYFNPKIDELTHFKTKSILAVPLIDNTGKSLGVIQVLNKMDGDFTDDDLKKVKLLTLLAISALTKIQDEQEMKKMKKRLREYNQSKSKYLIWETKNHSLKKVYEKITVVAKSNSSVLLLGESGTGKEVMARFIHEQSERKNAPFVAVNCAAIPKDLFEAELFGIKKGTATGVEEREGLFHKAHGGTLFFDEIGELPFELQSKLLRVLQEKKVSRLGEAEELPVDCRIISATNRDLKSITGKDGGFREDLFFRINVFEFQLPPLRERGEDIESLCQKLIENICYEQNFSLKTLSSEGLQKLMTYSWPGNIRELKNVLERACVLAQGKLEISGLEILLPSDLPPAQINKKEEKKDNFLTEFVDMETDMGIATKKFQKAYALRVINAHSGNKSQAAKELKLSREGLRKILNRDVA